MPKGKAVIMGQIEVVEKEGENFKTSLGLLIVFDNKEDLREAIRADKCTFTIG